jgi:hypothetical protein
MEKQLCTIGYWLGLICTVLALVLRLLGVFNISSVQIGASNAVTYMGFIHAAVLFFLLSIASWCRTAKS